MLLEWWSGTECTIYTDPKACPHYGKENAIVVLNHKFEIDFLCGWSLAERLGILGVSGLCLHPSRSTPYPSQRVCRATCCLLSVSQNF
jgi:hypothetical protein